MRALVTVALILAACTPSQATSSPRPSLTAIQAQTSPRPTDSTSPTPTVGLQTVTPTAPSQSTPTATVVPASAPLATAAPTVPSARCPAQLGGDQATNRAPSTMRAAGHPGYDRVVIDFGPGAIPPYTVEQVDQIVQGGSGFPIQMQGNVFIRVHFAAAGGSGEYPGPRRLLPDAAVVQEVVFTEFEGATTVGIGLSRLVCAKLEILTGGRLVLDFYP